MVRFEATEGFEPEQGESSTSTRKRTRTSFPLAVLFALYVESLSPEDRDDVLRVNKERIKHMLEFFSGHVGFFLEGRRKRSCLMIKQEEEAKPQHPPTKMLKFVSSNLKTPIFTNRKLVLEGNRPLQVQLIDIKTGDICDDSLEVEIVVLSGDFCPRKGDEFEQKILTASSPKKRLLVGTNIVELKEGRATFNDLMIAYISKNFTCQTFKLGARVVQSTDMQRIKQACTNNFRVLDCRGEKDMKYDDPSLDDDVWRLNSIAKDGTYHRKLLTEFSIPIKTVRDFLKEMGTNPQLRNTLKITERKWLEIEKQAKKALLRGETSMPNSGGNETAPSPVPQILEPPLIPPHPIQETPQNMGVPEQLDHHRNSRVDQRAVFPNNLASNQGVATNCSGQRVTSSVSNSTRGFEAGANTLQQFSSPTIDFPPSNPFENMGASQQIGLQTHSQVDQREIFPSNPAINQGELSTMFNSTRGSVTNANLCSTSYNTGYISSYPILPGNMHVSQQLNPPADQQSCQAAIFSTNLISNQVVGNTTNCLDPGERSMIRSVLTSRGYRTEVNPLQFSVPTNLPHHFDNTGVLHQVDLDTYQISASSEINDVPGFNEDEAPALLYSQPDMNQYDFGGELSNIANFGRPYFHLDRN